MQGLAKNIWLLILWRGVTGLFAGSVILVQAFHIVSKIISSVIADIIDTSERSKYLARLDAVISASYIIGQGIGGLLGIHSPQLPLYPFLFVFHVVSLLPVVLDWR